ncbi:MAG: hypothetical protein P4L41_02800 [Flavipsychrobacter sp.]|nr:hypothetical protein [Flavipsychrobacter sp.]
MTRLMLVCGIVIPLLILFGANGIITGTPNNNSYCIGELKKTMKVQQSFIRHALASGKEWHMKYTLVANALNPNNKQFQDVTSTGELKASTKMRYTKSGKTEVFMDEHDVFTVYADERVLMRTRPPKGSLAIKDEFFESLMQDSIFKTYQLISCNNVPMKSAGDSVTVRYELAAKNSKKAPYTNIVLYVVPTTMFIKKVDVTFNTLMSKTIHSYSLTINERNELKAEPELDHVKDHFFNKSGRLKYPYNNYEYKAYN